MLIDLHTHTRPASDDSSLEPDRLIEEARKVGLDGVCITDHDRFLAPDVAAELSRRHRFLVIPGAEVNTDEGHLLVFGLTGYVYGMHRSSFVRRMVDDAGGAVVVAHPYRRMFLESEAKDSESYKAMLRRAYRNSVFRYVEAVDVMNGRASPGENSFSRKVADHFGLRGVGASDAHEPSDIGTFATRFERRVRGLEDFVSELREGRFSPVVLNGAQRPPGRGPA